MFITLGRISFQGLFWSFSVSVNALTFASTIKEEGVALLVQLQLVTYLTEFSCLCFSRLKNDL